MSADRVFDPLAPLRGDGDPEVDVFLQGMVFLDIIFTGLSAMPKAVTWPRRPVLVSTPRYAAGCRSSGGSPVMAGSTPVRTV